MANTEYKVPRGTLTRTRQLIETVIAKLQETGRYEDVDRAMLELLTSSYDKMLRADDTQGGHDDNRCEGHSAGTPRF